jgi:hypothetical protein
VKLRESVGDEDTGVRTQTVVVEIEMLKRDVLSEESDQRGLRVQAEGIVVKVDGVKLGKVEDGGKERGKRLGNFVEETSGEDVGKVGNLTGYRWLVRMFL